ncbi:hypothetical protein T484DRAFT_1783591 [Baffinella frigidus]|nr:hypothetical protein T484DRAFT_1783591 [Cryptophyta sp. CCMP2293]
MGLFGFKARAPSQAREVLGGMDDEDDLDLPSTSSLAQRSTFRGGVLPGFGGQAGGGGHSGGGASAAPAAARVARKRTFDLDDEDLELSQPPAGAAQLKASRLVQQARPSQGQPPARPQARPSQPRPLSVQDQFPSFEEEFERAAHGRQDDRDQQPPASLSQHPATSQHSRASHDDMSPSQHRPTDPGSLSQHPRAAVPQFRARAPSRQPLSLFSLPSDDPLRDMPPPSQRAHQRAHEPAPSQGLRRVKFPSRPPALLIPGPAGGQEEAARAAIADPTQGDGAVRGPELPLRKRFQAPVQNDRDFQSPAWRRLLSDLDLPSFEGSSGDSGEAEAASRAPGSHSTIASVIRGIALKKMDRLLVIVKSITVSDHCADAVRP